MKLEETMSENGNGNSIGGGSLTGFVLGALVGAGVALLYAPCAGKETRALLRRKTGELKDKSYSVLEDAKGMIRREGKHIMSETNDLAGAHNIPSYTGAGGSKSRA